VLPSGKRGRAKDNKTRHGVSSEETLVPPKRKLRFLIPTVTTDLRPGFGLIYYSTDRQPATQNSVPRDHVSGQIKGSGTGAKTRSEEYVKYSTTGQGFVRWSHQTHFL